MGSLYIPGSHCSLAARPAPSSGSYPDRMFLRELKNYYDGYFFQFHSVSKCDNRCVVVFQEIIWVGPRSCRRAESFCRGGARPSASSWPSRHQAFAPSSTKDSEPLSAKKKK